ncbi:MAG TPA: peptide deformylase [Spirochaetota bacterium]|nr:peptide deformylase [Spirochaetota bacterium]
MILDIVTLNSANKELLWQNSKSVTDIDTKVKELIENMLDTMYYAKGIGLSAVQVGVLKKIFVIDIPEQTGEPLICINPEIIRSSRDYAEYEEGCLSIPGVTHRIQRPRSIALQYTDLDSKKQELTADDLLATCIQHEYDHLFGKLFIEHAAVKEYKKINKLLEDNNLPPYLKEK